VRTELKDVASSLSVVTKQFLENTGSKNIQDLLVYTTNTEVGGIWGNFSGAGGSQTYSEAGNLLRPANNTRVRGLDAADNTRDYFLSDIPWDSYIVDRVDIQRGPNSMLFGVGSPAGIINASLNSAAFKNANKFETRIDRYGSLRNNLDVNYVILKNQLAVRFSALDDDTEYQQRPAYNHDKRLFGALRFDPKLFENGHTTIRVNYENGDVKANRPRSLPPVDAITAWFKTGNDPWGNPYPNKATPDSTRDWTKYTQPTVTPWYSFAGMGRLGNPDIALFFNYNDAAPLRAQTGSIGTGLGLNSAGGFDGSIGGIQFGRPFGLPTFNGYATSANIPGGSYYGNVSLSDPSIYNFYKKLMDGDNKREYQKWRASNLAVAQTFFDERVGFELVYDAQRYQDGQIGFLNGGEYVLSVDINAKLADGSDNVYRDKDGKLVTNIGRPYVGNSGQYGNNENYIDRDSFRFTATGDFRTEDVWGKSLLTKILGHHVFTGLLSQDTKRTDYRQFAHWAAEPAYADFNQSPGVKADITTGLRQVDWISYLGPTLMDRSSASGANINNINTNIAPQPYQSIRFFDSHWNAPGVNPGAYYEYISYTNVNANAVDTPTGALTGVPNGRIPIGGPVLNGGYQTNDDGTPKKDASGNPIPQFSQSDNPANYVGWVTKTYKTLSSDRGDVESLYTSGQKSRLRVKSMALTWQGYFYDGTFVPVVGWRHDKVTNANSQARKDINNVSLMSYDVDTSPANTKSASGNSKSYGFVLHTPKKFQDSLPLGTHFSVFANQSENFKADAPRGDIFGALIPNQTGNTKEYGVVVSTLNDKLTLKATWYKTKVENATLTSDSAGFGNGNLYYAWALPYWEATHALAALDGIAVPQLRQGSGGWPWNTIATLPNGSPDPVRIAAIVKDFFTNFPLDQKYIDQYGLGMIIDKMHSNSPADWYAAIPQYGSGSIANGGQGSAALGLQPAYAGNLRDFGSGPVAVGSTLSKGVEIEVVAQPTKEWSLSANASQTKATRTSISPSLDKWITTYTNFMAGDAGLIKLWGGDTFRKNWQDHIVSPYAVLKAQIGLSAPEIPKWAYNLTTNYNFSKGWLKGANAGVAYRWLDKRILGYKYNPVTTYLDVNKPWYGPTEEHFDAWVGYGRKVTDKIHWRIQLNMRNVGESNHLVPVNKQPDGSVALSRIQDGMGWQLTNTFTF
jgi:hypothetical protein